MRLFEIRDEDDHGSSCGLNELSTDGYSAFFCVRGMSTTECTLHLYSKGGWVWNTRREWHIPAG